MAKELSQNFTPQQYLYMSILADPNDKRTDEEVAKEVGVSRRTLWEWRQKDGFLDEAYKILEKNVKSHFNEIFDALITKAKQGDTQAAKLVFESMGKLRRDTQDIHIDKAVFIPLLGGDSVRKNDSN